MRTKPLPIYREISDLLIDIGFCRRPVGRLSDLHLELDTKHSPALEGVSEQSVSTAQPPSVNQASKAATERSEPSSDQSENPLFQQFEKSKKTVPTEEDESLFGSSPVDFVPATPPGARGKSIAVGSVFNMVDWSGKEQTTPPLDFISRGNSRIENDPASSSYRNAVHTGTGNQALTVNGLFTKVDWSGKQQTKPHTIPRGRVVKVQTHSLPTAPKAKVVSNQSVETRNQSVKKTSKPLNNNIQGARQKASPVLAEADSTPTIDNPTAAKPQKSQTVSEFFTGANWESQTAAR